MPQGLTHSYGVSGFGFPPGEVRRELARFKVGRCFSSLGAFAQSDGFTNGLLVPKSGVEVSDVHVEEVLDESALQGL